MCHATNSWEISFHLASSPGWFPLPGLALGLSCRTCGCGTAPWPRLWQGQAWSHKRYKWGGPGLSDKSGTEWQSVGEERRGGPDLTWEMVAPQCSCSLGWVCWLKLKPGKAGSGKGGAVSPSSACPHPAHTAPQEHLLMSKSSSPLKGLMLLSNSEIGSFGFTPPLQLSWLSPCINVCLFLWMHWPLDLSASFFQEVFYVE